MIASEGLPLEVACGVLDISSAGYYAWRSRPPSPRTVRHETRPNERARTVSLASRPPERVKLRDQGWYFERIKKRRNVANSRAARYLARCHRRSLPCGRAPGSANCAGALLRYFQG